ncbi:TPA: hypothetical protein DEB00_00770 [Candidatus Uhrbacteria bacterium]|nr:hypothetical protein [Candidatus Uhrbacteria bacterium]
MKILIFGGGYIGARCHEAWKDSVLSDVRITCKADVLKELETHQPDVVLNAAGIKGKPNVDWCEDHQMESIRGNTILPLEIADACAQKNVYLLHIGSGCIFYGDAPHPDKRWREMDFGNPLPVYSRTKWAADLCLSTLPHVGVGRIRMPIDHVSAPGNLINKLASYSKVIDVENSATVIDDMVDVFYQLMEKRATGIFHVTNPEPVRHREILALYEEIVDPSHINEWIANDDLVKQDLAIKGRSNNVLATDRLAEFGIHMRPTIIALRDTMEKFAKAQKIT